MTAHPEAGSRRATLEAVTEAVRKLRAAERKCATAVDDEEYKSACAACNDADRQIDMALAAYDAAAKDDGWRHWVEQVRDGLGDIIGSVDGCLDAPRDPTSLPQMIRYEAARLLALLPPPRSDTGEE